jgi:hypothetical protein
VNNRSEGIWKETVMAKCEVVFHPVFVWRDEEAPRNISQNSGLHAASRTGTIEMGRVLQ